MIEQIGLIVIGLLMVSVMVFPFRQEKWVAILLGVGLTICFIAGDMLLGNYTRWQAYENERKKIIHAKSFMHQFKSTEAVIQALRARLDHSPRHAKGWYLLGRLYASQGRWKDAKPAFAEAHRLQPKEMNYWVQYTMSLSQGIPQQLSETQREQFKQILRRDSNQPEALMFLAMDANLHHQVDLAIAYWRKLLRILPADSEEAALVRKAIEKAS